MNIEEVLYMNYDILIGILYRSVKDGPITPKIYPY